MTAIVWIVVVSLIFSAFFSGMEIAFVSSNRVRFELDMKKETLLGRVLNLFYHHQEQFISTMLVGNNIALVIYGIGMAELLSPVLSYIYDNDIFVLLSQTLLSTLLILLTAEFFPKTLFRINPNSVLRFFALPVYPIYLILYPLSKLTSLFSKGVLWLSGVKISNHQEENAMSKVDLDFFIQQSIDEADNEQEVETEMKIFRNALDFSNVKLRDCMIPRNEIVAVDRDKTMRQELISTFIETGLSKIIVYKENIDDIVGYIHSSEMFKQSVDWRVHIKPILQVPETMLASKLMKSLMQQKRSIAVVIDEFGGTSGIITLEDLLEEICGDIEDEHDIRNYVSQKVGENEYLFSGRLEIEKINEMYDLEIPESDEYQTIAGYILYHHKTIPQQGEIVEIGPYKFKILKRNATKIEIVRMKMEK
ncbi:hemolysin family protein [Coprobacter secundus]|uniref:Hemolysin n=1 Tax=Coprobacter secundus subsp. similis TaxID=2751153 RepID=A0A7G1HTV1_9BACT|nr:hemolysin family protein [Coprobacter secundus]KHM47835.1 hemolysin [Coprobacter secundus]BCI62960.1 hemolysin [Coprobacter secundus subsp. similis]CCY38004.1 putative uncharacterized protein [Tannerella sp. CAG:118]